MAPRREPSPTDVRRLVAQLTRLCWLDLTGGEPLLRRDFVQILAAVADAGRALHVLHFQTNGTRRDAAVTAARAWRRWRPEVDLVVTVSLDGPPPVHDRMRGRPGSFDRALATLLALRHIEGVDVHVGTTVTRDNVHTVEALGEALEARVPGFDRTRWHVNLPHASGHFFGNLAQAHTLTPAADAVLQRRIAERGRPRDLVSAMELAYLVNLRAVHAGEASGIPCQALRSTVFVSPEGAVYPCHLWGAPLGDAYRTPFAEIWRSARLAAARRDVEALRCGGCFSACEAYPALAGSPVRAIAATLRRGLRPARSRMGPRRLPVVAS